MDFIDNLPGIYTLIHEPTKRFYIGSSKILRDRIMYHRNAIRRGDHPNVNIRALEATWEEFQIAVTYLPSVEDAKAAEDSLLKFFANHRGSCNIANDAYAAAKGLPCPHTGKQLSAETRARMSASQRLKRISEAGRRNIALGKQKPVVVAGVRYPSVNHAAAAHDLSKGGALHRLKSESFIDWTYLNDHQ